MLQESSSASSLVPLPLIKSERVLQRGSDDTDRFIRAIARKDHEAFAELFQRYAGILLALAQRILGSKEEAEEVLQEVLLYAWRNARRFDPKRASLSTWLPKVSPLVAEMLAGSR